MSELISKAPEQPPYIARELFAARDRSLGALGLRSVILRELTDIETVTEELFRVRYLHAGVYVRGLIGETENPYDHRDANIVNDRVRDAIEDRAGAFGIDTGSIA